ncbi:MAG: hypothetical protein WB760_11950 [Xanthobacteraceae bacterium]
MNPEPMLRAIAIFLNVVVLVAVATFQPGIFGTLGLFILAGILFVISAGLVLSLAWRENQASDQSAHRN